MINQILNQYHTILVILDNFFNVITRMNISDEIKQNTTFDEFNITIDIGTFTPLETDCKPLHVNIFNENVNTVTVMNLDHLRNTIITLEFVNCYDCELDDVSNPPDVTKWKGKVCELLPDYDSNV